jgi:hypothetical protein
MKKKGRLKMWLILLFFIPGVGLLIAAAVSAASSRSSIENALTAEGKVERVYKKVARDLEGKVERDWLRATFTTADGKPAAVEAEVFSTAFVSVGDAVTVRYDARSPTKGRVSAGFFAEPYHIVFLVLFGAMWLLIPTTILIFVLTRPLKVQD